MNATTRLLIAASVVVALGACAKKTKPVEEPAPTPPPAVAQPVDDGRYDPSDLDTDSCLRQRS
ncbi:MAG TPA: peptidoglycan-associated lipoprotein, partial [Arenimonas sp.]|nr:peptidoglycan-associated lipoprotein [Arenimonas sp.]